MTTNEEAQSVLSVFLLQNLKSLFFERIVECACKIGKGFVLYCILNLTIFLQKSLTLKTNTVVVVITSSKHFTVKFFFHLVYKVLVDILKYKLYSG
jgi:hypothetical protein